VNLRHRASRKEQHRLATHPHDTSWKDAPAQKPRGACPGSGWKFISILLTYIAFRNRGERPSRGSACDLRRATPPLATFGKAAAGGKPGAAFTAIQSLCASMKATPARENETCKKIARVAPTQRL
jgi:hypothetical protein